MKNYLILPCLMSICFMLSVHKAKADIKATNSSNTYGESVFELNRESLINKDKAGLEYEIGRKLTFKEKIALGFVKNKLKKNAKLDGVSALEEVKTDGMATAGLVMGLLGLFLGPIFSILAITFSSIALKRIKREPEKRKGKGLAIAGLVLGIVSLILWIALIIALASSGGFFMMSDINWSSGG